MTRNNSQQSTSLRLRLADAVGILLLAILLLTLSYFRSRHYMFWGDEIMGLKVLERPTWSSLLHYWRFGIDSSGFWFYVFGRPWIRVFGPSEVSLRMFSAVGIAASAGVLWAAARRVYPFMPVAAGVSFVYAFLAPLRWQLANGRTYGVLMLAVALVLYLLLRGEDADQDRPTPWFLLVTVGAYTLLNGSHILSLVYAGTFFAIQLALDLRSRRFRPLLYVAILVSFLMVLFSRANIEATVALGKPSFWTMRPMIRELLTSKILLGQYLSAAIGFLLLTGLLHLQLRRKRTPVYLILLGFGALDLVLFLYSRHTTSIYVERYLLPFAVAAVLLLCELFTQLREADAPWPRLRAMLPQIFIVLALAGFFVPRLQIAFLPFPNYTADLLAAMPPGLPVIDTDAGTFVEMEFYQHDAMHRVFEFPVDWQVALDHATPGGVSGFHEMDNWKVIGLYADDIAPTADVLAGKRDFLVLSAPYSSVWLRSRILANPTYRATKVNAFTDGHFVNLEIWRVQTR